ncbi:hypothetical protein COX00_03920 [Candidatus Uhrbacteria bacterium CG22_combo_CG10-13_8_21_14_all_47_17]|uniref:Uncharacterized protein n=1 Tax=Candidatus Uhrbacteria bacterium CG22_combo_CG10-13_8_21_14_all_47_17 TaxID=1975041 RepID=A0A2H0BTJ3_9BACT|nr:MAG: hypothetical protein COX00_03920 [Candidatus Uhrbacteria bacterium CG22_combo_CG10-13_8_21_14_all_47_17]
MTSKLPTELLYVQDLMTRLPSEHERILTHEIRTRARENLQCRAIRQLMNVQAWSSLRRGVVIAIATFILLAAFGELIGLAKWVQDLRAYSVHIPAPIGQGLLLSVNEFIPQSAIVDLAARFPAYGVVESAIVSLLVLVFLIAWRAYSGYFLFRQGRELKKFSREIEQELTVLREWQKEKAVDEPPKKT